MRSRASAGSTVLISSPVSDLTSSAMGNPRKAALLDRRPVGDALDLVGGAEHHDLRLVRLGLFEVERRVRADDDAIAEARFARGRTIEPDDAAAGAPFDHVRRKALAVVDV